MFGDASKTNVMPWLILHQSVILGRTIHNSANFTKPRMWVAKKYKRKCYFAFSIKSCKQELKDVYRLFQSFALFKLIAKFAKLILIWSLGLINCRISRTCDQPWDSWRYYWQDWWQTHRNGFCCMGFADHRKRSGSGTDSSCSHRWYTGDKYN